MNSRFDAVVRRCAAASMVMVALGFGGNARATAIDVLWYSYAAATSEYKSFYTALAATVSSYPQSTGLSWNLTFFGATDPAPDFSAYNVLVIESGEAFRTNAGPGLPYATPNYSGILNNRSAIEAARGNRSLIIASDVDFHAVRGDSGLCPDLHCHDYDGALGYVINSVNWAATGANLGILSFYDGDFPGSYWWDNPNSFLRDELHGFVSRFLDNDPIINPVEATYPMNQGLTSLGLSDWNNSFHGGFLDSISGYSPGYTALVDSSSRPGYAMAIATAIGQPKIIHHNVPEPATFALVALGLVRLGLNRRKCARRTVT